MNAALPLERTPLPAAFLAEVERLIPAERRFDDPLSTLAFGTDASFYRLVPKLVVRVESEAEVVQLLKLAHAERVPVTFRAAGTSLSGQAISDSVLIVLGDSWNGREIRNGGEQIRLQPGVIGANANAVLAPFQRKIGPDPASINAAKIGGIVANNSSGMCCGTAPWSTARMPPALPRSARAMPPCSSSWPSWAGKPAPIPNWRRRSATSTG